MDWFLYFAVCMNVAMALLLGGGVFVSLVTRTRPNRTAFYLHVAAVLAGYAFCFGLISNNAANGWFTLCMGVSAVSGTVCAFDMYAAALIDRHPQADPLVQ